MNINTTVKFQNKWFPTWQPPSNVMVWIHSISFSAFAVNNTGIWRSLGWNRRNSLRQNKMGRNIFKTPHLPLHVMVCNYSSGKTQLFVFTVRDQQSLDWWGGDIFTGHTTFYPNWLKLEPGRWRRWQKYWNNNIVTVLHGNQGYSSAYV